MRQRRGSVFIIALIVVTILTAVIATAAAATRVAQRTQLHRIEQRRAERMANSGVLYAMAQMTQVVTARVSLNDDWAAIGANGSEDVMLGDGSFRVEVLDAGSRANINNMTIEQLRLLPLTDEQIDSILDWREPDLQPRVQGAKDEYYEQLTKPYLTKLRNFDTVSELLMVKGFNANLLYEAQQNTVSTAIMMAGSTDQQVTLADVLTVDSLSSNLTEQGVPKTNVNTASAGQLVQAGLTAQLAQAIVTRRNQVGTFASWSQLLQVPGITLQNVSTLLDACTLETQDSSSGKVNINTASEQVLNLLSGMTPDVSQAIVARQGTFLTLGDIASVPGVSLAMIGNIAGSITISSEAFVVRVIGKFGTATYPMTAVVTIANGTPTVTKVEKYPFFDAAQRWGWADTAQTQTVLVDQGS